MMDPVIRGRAEDVEFDDLREMRPNVALVLLATDGSEPALAATQYAVLLARLLGARLKAIYVDSGFERLTPPEESISDERFEELDPGLQGLAVALRLAAANNVEFTAEVVKGGVASSIIGTATEEGAGLIVIGDTGRTGLGRVAVGSVATAVVKASEVPVLVTKAA